VEAHVLAERQRSSRPERISFSTKDFERLHRGAKWLVAGVLPIFGLVLQVQFHDAFALFVEQ